MQRALWVGGYRLPTLHHLTLLPTLLTQLLSQAPHALSPFADIFELHLSSISPGWDGVVDEVIGWVDRGWVGVVRV
jgi:hypothetical protein